MKEIIEKINELGEAFRKDALAQAENENKAAGVRVRRVSLEM
ncbi:MAG: histone H1 [Bacteroides sp.]|nr:histone H1 [Bacteroides sp.]